MKKERKSLANIDRPRLSSGDREEIPIDLWGDIDIRESRRRRARSLGRNLRALIIVVLLLGVMTVCALAIAFNRDNADPPIADTGAESESVEVTSKAPTSSETSDTKAQETSDTEERESETKAEEKSPASIYDFDYSAIPEGSKAIIPADLSLISYGDLYINNYTGYSPDLLGLLYSELGTNQELESLSSGAPLVLVFHTHGTEAYSPRDAISYTEDGGELARSHDPKENVIAVGSVLVDVLNKAGIPTVHSTVLHDSVQYKDAYARAEETVKKYLETYPSIRLVIDLHRDSIINSQGDIVRPVTLLDGEKCAQVKFTVGSSWSGEKFGNWERNLALALKLRKLLNDKYTNLCRPVDLRETTYNQELSPYSLLVEIGSSGNSLEEAMCAAEAVGKTLVEIIKMI